jgi:hypothetical protein
MSNQKFGLISESKRINEFIYHCFEYLKEDEARKFVNEFKNQPHDKVQVMHTFRELILGAYLSQIGYQMCHNFKIESKTPDWSALDESSHLLCILELINFHTDANTSADIIAQIKEKGLWCNFVHPNTKRFYSAISGKIVKYQSVALKYHVPYVVSIFGDFVAMVEQEELDNCLFGKETSLFGLYPVVSGVLYFEETSGIYFFSYKQNPYAQEPFLIQSGYFR